MVKLFCALVGAAGSAFSVRVDESDTVDDLKKAIKAEKPRKITCDADELQLYLAKKGDAWMTENEIKEVGSISGLKHLNVARARLRRVGLSEDDMNEVDEGEEAAGNGPVNVLVVVPAVDQEQRDEKRALPRTSVLNESDKYAEECISLREWGVGAVHEIPFIWKFMSSLGGCTSNGKIFWRLEDKQVVSILDDGWFRESTPDKINTHANKRSILMGSPGIGKSTMLCLMAFYLVFKHQKNVLVYRRLAKLNQSNCLLYLGHQGNRVVHFAIPSCTDLEACRIYGELSKQQGIENIWLLLDGLKYEHVPQELETFNLLATSQQVSLTSQERVDTYCCLLPCWAKKDLWLMGNRVYNYTAMDMEERFYYSGGSVREFTLATSEEIRNAIDDAVSGVDDVSNLLSNNSSVLTGKSQVDRLRHTFVKNPGDTSQFTARRYWEQVIDSEYAVLSLSVRLRSDALFRIYQWARGAGHGSLAGSVFEIYLHRLAADKTLRLYISEYDPPERRKPNEPRHLEVKQVYLKNGGAICCGTTSDHESHLEKWRDDEKLAYWFPACHDFPNIDSIVKLEPTSDMMSNIAYLQMTIAAEHEIDGKELKRMNAIFFPDDVKDAGDIKPSIYIAVCPDLKSCESLILKPGSEVLAARKACRVFVGYYDEAPYATAADGPMNNIPIKPLPPPPPYNLRKRLRTE